MSLIIPYHPSLVLGNIVDPKVIKKFTTINSNVQAINDVEEKLNNLISTYRSVDMLAKEINSLNTNINIENIDVNSQDLIKSIEAAAKNYVQIKIEHERTIQEIKSTIDMDTSHFESPLDYSLTKTMQLPLAADTLKLDCQYFSFHNNNQKSGTIGNIKKFVKGATQEVGKEISGDVTNAVLKQIHNQHDNHDVTGTIIMTATCTHKNVTLFDPFVLDINKTILIWNNIYPNNKIDISNYNNNMQMSPPDQEQLSILSGAVRGSCFIGMVHIVKSEITKKDQTVGDLADSVQEQLELGKWMASETGRFGVDPSFEKNIKNLLSIQNIDTHLNIVVMGTIPSIKSNNVETGIKKFVEIEPSKIITTSATIDDKSTVSSEGKKAQAGAQNISVYNSITENLLLNLDQIDKKTNSTLDMQTMLNAFQDYITKISSSKDEIVGIPINYYIRSFTKFDLEKIYFENYRLKSCADSQANIIDKQKGDDVDDK